MKLNEQQFEEHTDVRMMPLHVVGAMHSANTPGMTVDEWDEDYRQSHGPKNYGQGKLDKNMAEHGFDPGKPALLSRIGNGIQFDEGHHRYSAAKKAGLTEIPVRY